MKWKLGKLKNLSYLVIFLVSSALVSQEIKVMTWNIWHGGLHGKRSEQFKKDTLNTQNVLKVLKANQSDVLLMQETYCCGMEIAREAGYPYSWRSSSNLSIHSKFPIVDTLNIYKPFNSQGVVLDVRGKKVLCFNIWLDYLPDTFKMYPTHTPEQMTSEEKLTRVKEIKAILKEVNDLASDMKIPIIMGGDFNSASHLDWVESTKQWHFGKVVEWPVSKVMENNGFIDSFRRANPAPENTMQGTWGYLSDGVISDRIDFIYYRGENVEVKGSKIVLEDPLGGFFNSDHRAILTLFDLGG
ncbi:endonuclease/exonuclease/phosphatase family protein [Flagellimonas sp.]|uniref:endonuclease/exonuclease/phosphatase family protein n=1 Tax=Flagellimonas sp. TaxID=2058762 RepID=UPI003B50FE7D